MTEAELTIEQQFAIKRLGQRVQEMSREELLEELVATYRKMILDDARFRVAIGQKWGLK